MNMARNERVVALTIAGSDSGGGAGIQADLKTFESFGVFGTSAITAVTAQNTVGVRAVFALEPALVIAQVEAVIEDLEPAACKTGMLANADIASAVAETVSKHERLPLVVDPVMVSTSGDRLLTTEAIDVIRDELIPLAELVTPNLEEASILAGRPVETEDDMRRAAETICSLGCRAVLVKGGHLSGPVVVDLYFDGSEWLRTEAPRHQVGPVHGTGCTLSAAITAGLSLGATVPEAVDRGLAYVRRAIAAAPMLGRGSTPVDHSVNSIS